MTKKKRVVLLAVFFGLIQGLAISGPRSIETLQNGWKFALGQQNGAFEKIFDDSAWREVSVPHDWGVEAPFIPDGIGYTGKLPWKNEGWYRRPLKFEAGDKGKTVYLLFDGVMAMPKIYVNGQLAGSWDYGYNSFYVDITKFLNFDGKDVLAVHADTRNHDSRWYAGGGIYRKVQMIKANRLHAAIWGIQLQTPVVKPHYADVRVKATVNNHTTNGGPVTIRQSINAADGSRVAESSTETNINTSDDKDVETLLTISNPRRWDIDDPHLYTLITQIYQGDELLDQVVTNFGVRTMRFSADHGFYLNNRRVQLKGVNLHHDHGPLGAAFYERAMERQLQIMKDMGCNAVRSSHNVPAPELLDLCDRMGMLVYNEAFDKHDGKSDIQDTTDFDRFAHRNIRNFVCRDRNHPSVFIWSVANEDNQIEMNQNGGIDKLNTMLSYVRLYDPTRPTTIACHLVDGAKNRHFDLYDIHSWNYNRRYSLARQMAPDKSVIISESASTVSTRGFYEFPLPEKKIDFTDSRQVSSYDLHAPHWAEIADDDFMWQQDEPYVAGEFVWTGFDYLGEPTPYHDAWAEEQGFTSEAAARSSYFGIVDLCGIPKDRFYLYKSYWNTNETTIHILPHWNWPDRVGKNVPVFVYTNGDCAELFLNGVSLGKRCKKPKSNNSVDRFRLMWKDVMYEPGELKVVAYKNGKKLGENMVKTSGDAKTIRLTPDRSTIDAGGNDLSYILVEALDKQGNLCPVADNRIEIEVRGEGMIAGVGNGNPQSLNALQSSAVDLFYGKAMLIIKSGEEKGKIKITAKSENLKKDQISIRVK